MLLILTIQDIKYLKYMINFIKCYNTTHLGEISYLMFGKVLEVRLYMLFIG